MQPILWPECKRLLEKNPNFVLMEDGAPSHTASYTNRETETERIPKAIWPSNSPDFNPIERIWIWLRAGIDGRDISTVEGMKKALLETWEALSVEHINREIEKLPHIMAKCISVNGGNNFAA